MKKINLIKFFHHFIRYYLTLDRKKVNLCNTNLVWKKTTSNNNKRYQGQFRKHLNFYMGWNFNNSRHNIFHVFTHCMLLPL